MTKTKESLDKLHKGLEQKDNFKEILAQTPKKRNSFFSDLDFSIRYGKMILKEKLSKKSNEQEKDEWDIWITLTKLINFEKWMSFEEFPDLRKVLAEVSNPEEWIRK